MTALFVWSDIAVFRRLKERLFRFNKAEEINLRFEMHLKDHEIRVLNRGVPIQLVLGKEGRKLHLYPNSSLKSGPHGETDCFILFDPDRFYNEISGFLRLSFGETLVIGGGDKEQKTLFQFPATFARRHLSIFHAGDALVFKDHHTDDGTYISSLSAPQEVQRLVTWRGEKLRQVREIYGGQVAMLSSRAAFNLLRQVNTILGDEAHRPKDSRGLPGGIITPIFWGGYQRKSPEENQLLTDRLTAHYAENTPIGRAGMPEDIAQAALFLASDDSSYVTGQNVVVEGGRHTLGRSCAEQIERGNARAKALKGE